MQNSILVPTDRGMQVIEVQSIIRVQSISNYSKLFFQNGKTLVVAKVLRWFEERLQHYKFMRIHRTHLVNSSCLKAYNGPEIELTNGERFTVARRKRTEFLQSVRLLCTLLLFSTILNAQSVGVGTATPDASAILDVSGTTGGLLMPRLTLTQRDAITNPARGLVFFCSTDTSFYCYDGAWKKLAPAEHVWGLQGNSGINSGSHFIGTTDTAALAFAVNKFRLMRLHRSGRLDLFGFAFNTIVGSDAGRALDLGSENVLMGHEAGVNLTEGSANTFVGSFAGRGNTQGNHNTYIGRWAGNNSLLGEQNTFIGAETGYNNSIGTNSVLLGFRAGYNNNGNANTIIGSFAGQVSHGSNLHLVGYRAGLNNSGANNHFTGYLAGEKNTTGFDNHFSGYRAGANNTTGLNNYFSGHDAGHNNVDGNVNTFIGYNSGFSNVSGRDNTFIGHRTGFTSNGSRNVYIGWSAGSSSSTAENNVFIGTQSAASNTTGSHNSFLGFGSGASNTTGFNNVFNGMNAGITNSTGSGNTLIGTHADVTADNLTNAGAIGYNAKVSQSNSFVIGGTGADAVRVGIGISNPVTQLHVNGVIAGIGPFLNLSDSRVKKNILPLGNALSGILQLQPVSYDWKKEAYPQLKFDDKRQIGFLAQELQKIFPEAVTLGSDGFYTISYTTLIPVVVQGMKEQQQQVNELKQTVEMLVKEIEKLKNPKL